ncbi:Cysteine dioxygenase type I [Streptoalloteichus tenebrarius]|uniref:Cysteine dioxygenase type I n=1 Tax=Streptoalloteichus tenebrarius (strain ATCC 17920 / DSM 40477 / JCM 4838 / CBS 697.72 / NBRC 16177 / NCIMB 11028 / NRRL B-12390 / A12253. 1 / ISP 5477) TaxID=1933 RepID=A0ABT1HZH6_STRSD|nr:cysteine dioxygenase family protein [Streptoalloteichus tenebrarius]MCP2260937.1 Cysteine dioxygenase type I [Streptoalloteichus tenebrarius]BFF03301.1 cysteine dioxygenase family protein [Streptoalloteichus tenebrarius]
MFAVPPNTVAATASHTVAHPALVAMAHAADNGWRRLLRYDPDRRWTALLDSTEDHEVWLMSWLPGQHTDLHDHAGSTGAFTVVSGVLSERVARAAADGGPPEATHLVRAGQTRVFGPGHVHRVANEGVDPAVSVHVFRPGRRGMNRYRTSPAGPIRLP